MPMAVLAKSSQSYHFTSLVCSFNPVLIAIKPLSAKLPVNITFEQGK
jgi:hypothetical protein